MTRSFLLTVFLVGVLFCAPQNALAANWLEPGVYADTDSNQSGEVHAFGNAERLSDLSEKGISDLASVASSKAGSGYLVATTAGKIRAFGDAAHRGEGRHLQHVGVVEIEHALVAILFQKRVEHGA